MNIKQANDIIRLLGFTVLGNSKMYEYFYLGYGSVANGKTVTLSKVEMKLDPLNNAHPSVFVTYKSWSEAGEDLCDYHSEETRWVAVEKLEEFLVSHGVLRRTEVQNG